ncbi:C3HC zinc finger-like-domain-containing protein [Mycena maculata]|uniref:C3HC zinc finger-like-domain-containing protein n=1 Tax=Mycena maculata TaxID=230809 RepID=A0AAD7HSG0_9AGAR|nr:C3HC zinc finger-like-domain-containing protein [Mycena maculata]
MSATKRKLDDAFHSLDQAVEARPPAKRANTARSLYSTLTKYGVKTKKTNRPIDSLSKSTPHLTAILARAATRTRKALPFSFGATPPPALPATAEYRPSSIPSFLARLATFKLLTYANKPPQIDAVAASKCGWINDGKDRLVCGLCGVSWVVAGRDSMTRDAANALVEKQRVSLVEMHKNGCPWKTRQCDPSIYRIPLQAPSAMVRQIKTGATVLDPIMQQVHVKHPLTANQLASLRATITAFPLPPPAEDAAPLDEGAVVAAPEPSETAILTALFGWAPPPPSTERPRLSSSLSRPSSRAGSPFPGTPPRLSRASSRAASAASTSALPPPVSSSASTPAAAVPGTPRQFLRRISSVLSISKHETALLHCALCQRRVGLWAFAPPVPPTEPDGPPPPTSSRAPAPQRHLDLLKEHRSFCPYVVRSTLVPSLPAEPTLPASTAGVLEGWRAVLTVVLRYGMGQRQRMRRRDGAVAMDVDGEDGTEDAVDGVEAMVASVKNRGGKELLKYVKGLLG